MVLGRYLRFEYLNPEGKVLALGASEARGLQASDSVLKGLTTPIYAGIEPLRLYP